jgi:hypothetical protein
MGSERKILISPAHSVVLREKLADAALSPGHLLARNSDDEVLKHATADVKPLRWVALEDPNIGRTIDTAYAAGELVPCHIIQPGDKLRLKLPAAATAITKGARLTPDATGCVVLANAAGDYIIASADEAVDNSGGGGEVFINCTAA